MPDQTLRPQAPGDEAGAVAGSVAAALAAMRACQQDNGALVASPDFAEYRYCWLRDSSFAAYAFDLCGEHDAAARYHDWANIALDGVGGHIDLATRQRKAGRAVDPKALPPARFRLDGTVAADGWPNFQIDGYGTWLWSLREHLRSTGRSALPPKFLRSAQRAASYLAAFALDPCYDVWEENGDGVHTSTLACAYGGLTAAASLLNEPDLLSRAREVQTYVQVRATVGGRYCKSSVSTAVDASLIWLATPFGLVDGADPLFRATVRAISEELTFDGGLRRFPSDTFFGGGAWPVLTASLGWHQAVTGDNEGALRSLAWVAGHIDSHGRLGEQFGGERRLPASYREWVDRWGHPARELLWSHAMYAVLSTELGADREDESTYIHRQQQGKEHGQ